MSASHPPPPTLPTSTEKQHEKKHPYKRSLEILVSYPQLIPYEESLFSTPYDVSGWCFYLSEIDSILESLSSHYDIQKKKQKPKDFIVASSSSQDDSLDAFVFHDENDSVRSGMSIQFRDIPEAIQSLGKARIMVGERSLSLLPGSYKLWIIHLHFLIRGNENTQKVFLQDQKQYHKTISAFERSLVRMNKMPRIWILYLQYVREHDIQKNVTNLRRLHDRALLALPVTQHEHIWVLYKDWITSTLPNIPKFSLSNPNPTSHPNNNPILKEYKTRTKWENIPPESILRVLRRYTLYEPTGREYFAKVCLSPVLGQYGEGCKMLVQLLNEGDDFLSPDGTTPHDLWMELAKVCTKHPEETRKAGVDFDLIVRAILKEEQENKTKIMRKKHNAKENSAGQDLDDNSTFEPQVLGKTLKWGEIEGALWCKLGDYHIRNGEFELARSVFEEGLERVVTVRDFGMIFDAYANFEEGTIAAMMELMHDDEDDIDTATNGNHSTVDTDTKDVTTFEQNKAEDPYDSDLDILLSRDTTSSTTSASTTNAAIELSLARAEYLMERRPLLLNRVLVRQNPHNVGEWLRRAELYTKQNNHVLAIEALQEATKKVHARKAVNGNPAQIWIKLGSITERHESLDKARNVFRQVCEQNLYKFKHVDDLAQVYCAYVEMELNHDCFENALLLIRQAVADPPRDTVGVGKYLHKSSLRLWNLALDLEESLSNSISSTRDAYERCIHLKVATPTIILNYAAFLKQKEFFEESFAAYEKGLDLFPPPHSSSTMLWKTYLEAFVERYQDTKIIRTRELFERCLSSPHQPDQLSPFYLLYTSFEKNYAAGPSLTKRLLQIYERQCTALPLEKKLQAYQLYIAKTNSLLGPTATRPLYETAIQACNDQDASILCYEFAQLEEDLGEIARARAAFTYGSQLVDPRRDMKEYWKKWSDFEILHGDEESFREMLRVKRAVTAAFSTVNYNAAEMGAAVNDAGEKVLKEEEALDMLERSEGVKARVLPTIGGFVSGTKRSLGESRVGLEEVEKRAERLRRKVGGQDNEEVNISGGGDEIDIDDADNGEEMDDIIETDDNFKNVNDIKTKSVPSMVFGGLADAAAKLPFEERSNAKKMGALERLRMAAVANSNEQTN